MRAELSDLWADIVIGTSHGRTADGSDFTDVDRVVVASVAVFDLAMSVTTAEGEPVPVPATLNDVPIVTYLKRRAGEIRVALRMCLNRVGENPDFWKEIMTFGLLLHPHGAVWVPLPFHLGARGEGTELERGVHVALGAPEVSDRAVSKVRRAYLRVQGYQRPVEKPGPKPDSRRSKSVDWQKFEAYVLSRLDLGVSPQMVVDDAHAQSLYEKARDIGVVLSERTVRRVRQRRAQPK